MAALIFGVPRRPRCPPSRRSPRRSVRHRSRKAGQPTPVAVSGTTVRKGDTLAAPGGHRRAHLLQGANAPRAHGVRPGWRLQGLALRALSDGIGFAVLPGEPATSTGAP